MKFYKKRWIQSGIALICSLAIVLSVFPVLADNEEINNLEDQSSSLESELQGINEDILALSDEISTTEMQVEMLNGEIARTSDELDEAMANEERQYEDMKARIKYMYEHGNATLLELLFSAEDMSDFLNKADFIENLSEYDRNALNDLKDIHQQIEDEQKTLETQQASLTDLQEQLQNQQTELQAKADATSTNLADVQARLQQAKEEEAARIAAEEEAARQAAASVNNNPGSGNSGGAVFRHRYAPCRNDQGGSGGDIKGICSIPSRPHNLQYIHLMQQTDTVIPHSFRRPCDLFDGFSFQGKRRQIGTHLHRTCFPVHDLIHHFQRLLRCQIISLCQF